MIRAWNGGGVAVRARQTVVTLINQLSLPSQPGSASPHHHHHHLHGPSPLYVRCSMTICGVPEGSVKMVCRKRFPGFRGASSHLPQSATLLNSLREKATFLSNKIHGTRVSRAGRD